MNMKTKRNVPVRSAIAIALALAFPVEGVLADEVKDLTNPDVSEVSIRGQYLDSVNPQYRLYSGMARQGGMTSMDINLIKRDEEGVWVKVQGRELGLRTQEIGASVERQGDWRLGVESYNIIKYSPYTVTTKVSGMGTENIVLNNDFRGYLGSADEVSLSLERKGNSLTGSKFIFDNLKFNFGLKAEDKSGAIMSSAYGATWNTPTGSPNPSKNYGAQFFTAQPENYRHNQFEASLDYITRKFQLTGGVYLSVLDNANTAMNVYPGQNSLTSTTGPITSPWISLPPSNRATQWELSGAYNFSDLTRLSFKASKETATQDAPFIPAFGASSGTTGTYVQLNPPGVPYAAGITNTSLNGLVETTAYFAQLTTKLSTNLNMLFSWRYEDRDDKTPQRNYLDSTASAEFPTGDKNPRESHKINRGKAEATYRLPAGYSLTGGVDYDRKETPDAYRDFVTDQTLRVELRKALNETLNGKIMLAQSNRTGGDWHLLDGTPNPAFVTFSTTTGVAAPLQFVDRKRDKVKFMADWNPLDPLSFQAFYEYGRDLYQFTPPSGNAQMGMTEGRTDLFGLDVAYRISENWKVNGFYSFNQNKTHQNEMYTPRPTTNVDNNCTGTTITTSCIPWQADLNMTGEVVGVGTSGTLSRWLVGAQYLYSVDRTKYGISFDPTLYGAGNSVPAGAGVLPDTVYSLNRLRLTGTYLVTKATRIRLDYTYDQRTVDDYTWANWSFTDGTKVNVNPNQTTQLVGVTMIHSF
jgi:MtrB/PioB family decaheme-associated outer membrane protein